MWTGAARSCPDRIVAGSGAGAALILDPRAHVDDPLVAVMVDAGEARIRVRIVLGKRGIKRIALGVVLGEALDRGGHVLDHLFGQVLAEGPGTGGDFRAFPDLADDPFVDHALVLHALINAGRV